LCSYLLTSRCPISSWLKHLNWHSFGHNFEIWQFSALVQNFKRVLKIHCFVNTFPNWEIESCCNFLGNPNMTWVLSEHIPTYTIHHPWVVSIISATMHQESWHDFQAPLMCHNEHHRYFAENPGGRSQPKFCYNDFVRVSDCTRKADYWVMSNGNSISLRNVTLTYN